MIPRVTTSFCSSRHSTELPNSASEGQTSANKSEEERTRDGRRTRGWARQCREAGLHMIGPMCQNESRPKELRNVSRMTLPDFSIRENTRRQNYDTPLHGLPPATRLHLPMSILSSRSSPSVRGKTFDTTDRANLLAFILE